MEDLTNQCIPKCRTSQCKIFTKVKWVWHNRNGVRCHHISTHHKWPQIWRTNLNQKSNKSIIRQSKETFTIVKTLRWWTTTIQAWAQWWFQVQVDPTSTNLCRACKWRANVKALMWIQWPVVKEEKTRKIIKINQVKQLVAKKTRSSLTINSKLLATTLMT